MEESATGSFDTKDCSSRWSFETDQLLASTEHHLSAFPFEDEKFDSLDSDLGDLNLYSTTPPRNIREERRQGRRHSQKPPKLTIPKAIGSRPRLQRARHSVVRMEGLDETFYAQQQGDEWKQAYRMQSRQLDKERTREREFKHSNVSIDVTDTVNSERFHSLPVSMYDPLPSPIPKVDSFTPFRSIKSQQKSPPTSPTATVNRVKRLSSISSKLHCPPDRVEFHNIFSKLIRMGTKKDQNTDTR